MTCVVVVEGALTRSVNESSSPNQAEPDAGMSPAQLIDRIVTLNPTATSEFLAQFSPRSLGRYLAHLSQAQEPRGRGSRWSRACDTPAIVMAQR